MNETEQPAVAGPVEPKVRHASQAHAIKAAAYNEKQRIVRSLLEQAEAAHDARNYHDRDRYRDAAWLVERA